MWLRLPFVPLTVIVELPVGVVEDVVTVIVEIGGVKLVGALLLVGGLENVFQLYRGVTERDLYVMLLLFVFLIFRPGGIFAPKGGRD